jgi:hypothetical protein
MLDDHRRKAVATVGDFSHRASLPAASLPSYPVTVTKPMAAVAKRSHANILPNPPITPYPVFVTMPIH